jgi:predicted transcriptional regulator
MFKAFDIAYELNGQNGSKEDFLFTEDAIDLTPEQIKAIDEALDDVANGRVHTHEEVMRMTRLKYPKYFKE